MEECRECRKKKIEIELQEEILEELYEKIERLEGELFFLKDKLFNQMVFLYPSYDEFEEIINHRKDGK